MRNHLAFILINDSTGNKVLAYNRADDGTLAFVEAVATGGLGGMNEGGAGDPLNSQGSLVYNSHHRILIAVNAGSDTVSVFGPDDAHLRLRQVLPSGGSFPVSVTIHDDLVYVLNAHEAGTITGFRIVRGQLRPIDDSTRSLKLTPVTGPTQFLNTPAQIGFTADGHQLVVTTKANGSLIDVFSIGSDGRPSDTFVANPAGVPIPFGFTFDDYRHLVVTDAGNSTLSTYTVQHDGTVKKIASQSDGGSLMCWVAQVAGNFYVTDTGSRAVTGYRIDKTGTPTIFSRAETREGPIDLVGTDDGNYLYVQVGGAGGVDVFRVNSDGALSQIVTLNGMEGLDGIALT